MAFQLRYGTSKEPVAGKLKVILKSEYFSKELAFPPPGLLLLETFPVPREASFDLHCSFYVDDDSAGVRIEPIGANDSLCVVAFFRTLCRTCRLPERSLLARCGMPRLRSASTAPWSATMARKGNAASRARKDGQSPRSVAEQS